MSGNLILNLGSNIQREKKTCHIIFNKKTLIRNAISKIINFNFLSNLKNYLVFYKENCCIVLF